MGCQMRKVGCFTSSRIELAWLWSPSRLLRRAIIAAMCVDTCASEGGDEGVGVRVGVRVRVWGDEGDV